MTAYRVTAPLVLVRDQEKAFGYFYRGAVLPPYVTADAAKGLLDDGLIEKVEAPAAATPAVSEPPSVQPAGERPVQVAPKAAWVDYAVSQGADRDEAEALTKDKLIEQYGG